jgi:hypothetical protein
VTLLDATLRYSTLLYATLRYSTLLYATLRYASRYSRPIDALTNEKVHSDTPRPYLQAYSMLGNYSAKIQLFMYSYMTKFRIYIPEYQYGKRVCVQYNEEQNKPFLRRKLQTVYILRSQIVSIWGITLTHCCDLVLFFYPRVRV